MVIWIERPAGFVAAGKPLIALFVVLRTRYATLFPMRLRIAVDAQRTKIVWIHRQMRMGLAWLNVINPSLTSTSNRITTNSTTITIAL